MNFPWQVLKSKTVYNRLQSTDVSQQLQQQNNNNSNNNFQEITDLSPIIHETAGSEGTSFIDAMALPFVSIFSYNSYSFDSLMMEIIG